MMQWQFIVTSLVEWPKPAFYQSRRKQSIKAGTKNPSGSVVFLEDLRYSISNACIHHTDSQFVIIFQLSYDISKNQMQSLRASSRHASQNFKYLSHDPPAAIIFRTSNGKEISANQNNCDGCKVQNMMTA